MMAAIEKYDPEKHLTNLTLGKATAQRLVRVILTKKYGKVAIISPKLRQLFEGVSGTHERDFSTEFQKCPEMR